MDASADRIAQAITAQPSSHAVVVAAHNGPTGLGVQQHSICGADFLFHGGALRSSCLPFADSLHASGQCRSRPFHHCEAAAMYLGRYSCSLRS